ncbi:hypothetical protein ATK78_4483 [Pedobacter metabolipauper]|uniref:Uncharacterized protein n=2 Tax=Pedobacter metabolipauper TaxID=425513 RepID=A0A4R6SPF8_9SPHI|nr:hypothetical protein ATK78_4483 [Pedobacter metabolipauper]
MKHSLNIINKNFKQYIKTIRMRKIILSATFIALAGLATVKASEVKNPIRVAVQQDSTTKQDSTTRTPVEIKDLPEPVQKTLQTEPVKAWTPTDAFLVTNADKTQYYLVNVKKEQETGSLKIDKDGKIVQ